VKNELGSVVIRNSPCNPGIDIFQGPGQTDPSLRIFDIQNNLLQSFPAASGVPATAVITNPSVVGRNTIRPTADTVEALRILPNSATQSAPLFNLLDSASNPFAQIYTFDAANGSMGLGGTTACISAASNSGNALVLQDPRGALAGASDMLMMLASPDFHGAYQLAKDIAGRVVFWMGGAGTAQTFYLTNGATGDLPFQVNAITGTTTDIAQFSKDVSFQQAPTQGLFNIDNLGDIRFQRLASLSSSRKVTQITNGFLDNTDASWKGQGKIYATDSVTDREAIRWQADGSAVEVSIGGAVSTITVPNPTFTINGFSHSILTDASTSTITVLNTLYHLSSGIPTTGFGVSIDFGLHSSNNTLRRGGRLSSSWKVATDGSTNAQIIISGALGNSLVPCVTCDGTQTTTIAGNITHTGAAGSNTLGFFAATPVIQQANASQAAITLVADANAKSALQAIYNLLKNYGLAPATA
jgi:hypothetical protein